MSVASQVLFCRHETSSGYYRVSVYFIAKVITDLIVMRTVPLSIFCAITYFMIGKLNVHRYSSGQLLWNISQYSTPIYAHAQSYGLLFPLNVGRGECY